MSQGPRRGAAQLLVRYYVSQAHAAVRQREVAAAAAEAAGARLRAAGSSSSTTRPPILLQRARQLFGNGVLLTRGLTTTTGSAQQHGPSALSRGATATPWRAAAAAASRLRSTVAIGAAEAAAAAAVSSSTPASKLLTHPALRLARASLPETQRRQVALWLAACAAWTFSMVVLGGATRLTRSGLSMTDWRFSGERWPRTDLEWQHEFDKYRASPEFRLLHSHMTVDDFKFIFAMEYAHRMWGRLLGLGFALPAAYFAVRGRVNGPLAQRLGLLLCMGGAQGLVGWWMVRSGLKEPQPAVVVVEGEGGQASAASTAVVERGGGCEQVPRVSPYRLAAHLTSAFAIYATLVWTSLSLWQPVPAVAEAAAAAAGAAGSAAAASAVDAARRLRARALPLAALVGVTAFSGAFVAGLDAGHAYNTFPTMNGQWIPEEYWGEEGQPRLPPWRNAFENTAAVQLHHRALALTTLGASTALWLAHRSNAALLPPQARLLLAAAAGVTWMQAGLGVATLLTYVPPALGAAHQAGALTVFTVVLGLLHAVRPAAPSAAALAVSRMAPPLALVGTAAVATAVVSQY
jgi:cytochrome c oxidase assembly protein subunit 15